MLSKTISGTNFGLNNSSGEDKLESYVNGGGIESWRIPAKISPWKEVCAGNETHQGW